jgi:hypothetical protein
VLSLPLRVNSQTPLCRRHLRSAREVSAPPRKRAACPWHCARNFFCRLGPRRVFGGAVFALGCTGSRVIGRLPYAEGRLKNSLAFLRDLRVLRVEKVSALRSRWIRRIFSVEQMANNRQLAKIPPAISTGIHAHSRISSGFRDCMRSVIERSRIAWPCGHAHEEAALRAHGAGALATQARSSSCAKWSSPWAIATGCTRAICPDVPILVFRSARKKLFVPVAH